MRTFEHAAAERQSNPASLGRHDTGRRRLQSYTDSVFSQDSNYLLGNVAVLARQELFAALEHGHPAAVMAKHLPELDSDVSTAQDQEMLRQRIELHDRRRI